MPSEQRQQSSRNNRTPKSHREKEREGGAEENKALGCFIKKNAHTELKKSAGALARSLARPRLSNQNRKDGYCGGGGVVVVFDAAAAVVVWWGGGYKQKKPNKCEWRGKVTLLSEENKLPK